MEKSPNIRKVSPHLLAVGCEFNFCIYNKKGECTLESISISSLGLCEECLTPNIDDETLENYKNKVRNRLELIATDKK